MAFALGNARSKLGFYQTRARCIFVQPNQFRYSFAARRNNKKHTQKEEKKERKEDQPTPGV